MVTEEDHRIITPKQDTALCIQAKKCTCRLCSYPLLKRLALTALKYDQSLNQSDVVEKLPSIKGKTEAKLQ